MVLSHATPDSLKTESLFWRKFLSQSSESTLKKEATLLPETMAHISKNTRSHIKENLKLYSLLTTHITLDEKITLRSI